MIRFNNTWDGYAIAAATDHHFVPGNDPVIARVKGEAVIGGAIYFDYTHASIWMNVAGFGPNWLSRDLLWASLHYPFVQLGCEKVFVRIREGNLHSLEFTRKIGFREEARLAGVFPGEDLIIKSMLRADCRWLSLRPRTIKEGQ